jgi:hypothetical protein
MTLNGSLVETWKDKSGNGRDFTATSTARPSLTASVINSRSAVTFNGSTSTLTGNTAAQDVIRNLAGYTVFTVLRTATVAAGERLAFGVGATVLFRIGQQDSRPFMGGRRVSADTLESVTGTASDLSVGAAFIQTASVNHTSQSLTGLRNGATFASDATYMASGSSENVASSVSVGTQAGGTYGFWNGDIAETVVYNSAISTADRARVEAYLAAKWGISGVHAQATATSDPVGYWGDKSGNARHAVQATGANRPLTGTTVANNRRGVNFGTAGNLQRLGWLPDSGTQNWQEMVAVGVYDRAASAFADVETIFSGHNTNSGTALGIGLSGDGPSNAFTTQFGTFLPEANINALGHVATSLVRPFPAISSPFVVIGRATSAVAVAGYVVGNDRQFSFAGRNWRGRIAEVVAFERALTTAERNRIVRYLASKWGITLAPQVSNADAQDWINRVYANGGTVSASTAAAVNQFCVDIEAASIRDRFFRLNLFCGTGLNACLVPLYRGQSLGGAQFGGTTDTNVGGLFASGDYSETLGLLGNGSSKWLNTGFLGGTAGLTTSSVHLSAVWPTFTQGGSANTFPLAMINAAASERHWINVNSDTTPTTNVNAFLGQSGSNNAVNTISSSNGGVSIPGGLWLASRVSVSDLRLYLGNTERAAQTASIGSATLSTEALSVFGRWNGTAASLFFGQRMMSYSVGLGMSGPQSAAFSTAVTNFNAAMGRSV